MKRYIIISEKVTGHDSGTSQTIDQDSFKRIILPVIALLFVCATPLSAQFRAVRVDALALLTGTFHAGVDFTIDKKLSSDASFYWNPLRFDTFRSKLLVGQTGVRFWRFEPNVGSFLGTYIAAGNYDIGNRHRHHKGMLAGAGASYGYCWMLAKRWSLIAEIGAGLYYVRDTRREYFTPWSEDEIIRRSRRLMLLPSKAEVSFSYLF